MRKCDRCGFESHGCEMGVNFHALTIGDKHLDLCGDCGSQYWDGRREFCKSYDNKWLKDNASQ